MLYWLKGFNLTSILYSRCLTSRPECQLIINKESSLLIHVCFQSSICFSCDPPTHSKTPTKILLIWIWPVSTCMFSKTHVEGSPCSLMAITSHYLAIWSPLLRFVFRACSSTHPLKNIDKKDGPNH